MSPTDDLIANNHYPEETPVFVRYPLTKEQEHGERAAWPWLPWHHR